MATKNNSCRGWRRRTVVKELSDGFDGTKNNGCREVDGDEEQL
jgi:hypothetical protein